MIKPEELLKAIELLPKEKLEKAKRALGITIRRKRNLLCRGARCKFYNPDDDKFLVNGVLVKCRFDDSLVNTLESECPAVKSGKFKKYGFYCNRCKERLGTAYSDSGHPEEDRINLKYDQPIKNKLGRNIKGCLCPSITQDGKLAFECACGNDTRDFKGHRLEYKEKETSKGRDWGKKDSKFKVKEE